MAAILSWNFGHMDFLPLSLQRIEDNFDALNLKRTSLVLQSDVAGHIEARQTFSKDASRRPRSRTDTMRRKPFGAVDASRPSLIVRKSTLVQRPNTSKMFINDEYLSSPLGCITIPTIDTSVMPAQVESKRLIDTKSQVEVTTEEVHVEIVPQQHASPVAPLKGITQRPTLNCRSVEAPHMGWIEVVELHRPEAKNAISWQMLNELRALIDRIYQDHDTGAHKIRALVISSSLDDAFCAGADLKERKWMSMEETRSFLAQLRKTFRRLANLPIPTIACVSGLALGGGLELALCCHFRVFSSSAIVALPETRLAIIPGAGGTFRLPKVVGECNALDMILTGRRVHAVEAFRMGMCSRLIDVDESHSTDRHRLREATMEAGISLAKDIAAGGPIAIRAALRAVANPSEQAENAAYDIVLATEDRLRALDSFAKKCSPIFLGV